MWYLECNNHLSISQFGYRKLKSTLDPLTILDSDIGQAFNQRKYLTAIFLLIWKRPMKVMHAVGLRGHLPVIIKSFLSNRMFKVMINGITSEEYIQYECSTG